MKDIAISAGCVVVILALLGSIYWKGLRSRSIGLPASQFATSDYGPYSVIGREVELLLAHDGSAPEVIDGVLVTQEPGPFGGLSYRLEYLSGSHSVGLADSLASADREGRSQLHLVAADTDPTNPDPLGQAIFAGRDVAVVVFGGASPWGPTPGLIGNEGKGATRSVAGILRPLATASV